MLVFALLACAPGWREGTVHVTVLALDPAGDGEALHIVGPDGTSVLWGLGNDRHAGEVENAVEAARGDRVVDWVVAPDFAAPHIGGSDDLLLPGNDETLSGDLRVVSRGPVDLGQSDLGEFQDLQGAWDDTRVDLCVDTGTVSCPALADEATIPLGDGASLDIVYADGFIAGGSSLLASDADEAARALTAVLSFGAFRLALLGGGAERVDDLALDAPDVVILPDHGGPDSLAWLDLLSDETNVVVSGAAAHPDRPDPDVLAALDEVWNVTDDDLVLTVESDRYTLGDRTFSL